ncbi:MAG: helix-turn-helix transcriptional regulator [Deltaproteobacteria bacterium]|nr:helix-turn-helix transcriptional regulator [Deltaproteobacteria bacterium]
MQRDNLRDLIERWVRRTGSTKGRLAKLIGVHRTRLYPWMEGQSQPETEHLEALAEVLGERLSVVAAAIDESRRQREAVGA